MSAPAPAPARERTRTQDEHTHRRLSAPADWRAFETGMTAARRLAYQALRRWSQLTSALTSAYVEGDGHRVKRIRRVRRLAAAQAERRYQALAPAPRLPLGNLRHDPTARRASAERAAFAAAA